MRDLKNLTEVLQNQLKENEVIVDCSTKPLTAPGDNYGSIIMSVDVLVKNKSDLSEKNLHGVAKFIPENDFIRKMFNTNETFRNEIEFYRKIVPLLQNFQIDQHAPVAKYFPKFLGAKMDYDGPNIKDTSVLVLENLKPEFVVENRLIGFDFECTKIILENLANFHATGIAFKKKYPDVFDYQVKPYLDGTRMQDSVPQSVYEREKLDCENLLKEVDQLSLFSYIEGLFKVNATTVREPFATIVHSDFWVNNIMLNLGKKEVKIVDFQTIQYSSPADDLLLFLFTSIRNDVLKNQIDFFIKHYYKYFIKTLEDLKIDTNDFSYEAFEKELEISFKEWQFLHIIDMCYPILQHKLEAKELKEFSADTLLKDNCLNFEHKEKLKTILPMFLEKGWL